MGQKPPIHLIANVATAPADPPATLREPGRALWRGVMAQYAIVDAGGLEILRQAAHACDRADQYAAIIDAEGPMILTKTGIREHPLVKHEIAARALVARLIARLGLDLEPLRPQPGRPSSPVGWLGPNR